MATQQFRSVQRWVSGVAIGLASACGGDDTDETDPGGGACGDPTVHEVQVQGTVVEAGGAIGYDGVTVELWDGQWAPPDLLGTATTASDGTFTLDAAGVTDLPGCWGIVLDYTLRASKGEASAERDVNGPLEAAIRGGGPAVIDVPIELPVP